MILSLVTASLSLALGQTPDAPAATAVESEPAVRARVSFAASDSDFDEPDSFTLFHAALEARSAELTSGLRAEAALSLFVNPGISQGVIFRDNSSSFRLRYHPASWAEEESLALTVFPLSSTRVAMGYEQPVTWARQAFPRNESSGEPALELRLSRQRWNVWAAVKSARVPNDEDVTVERRLALLAGAGLDVLPALRLELEAARVDRGLTLNSAAIGAKLPVVAKGLSGRVQWHQGAPIGPNVDLSLYAGDPAFFERFFVPESYPGGLAAAVAVEGSFVTQKLEDLQAFRSKDEAAWAGALTARLKWDFLRVHALAYARSLSFVQVDVPGYPPYAALREDSDPLAEVSGSVGADYHFPGPGLTLGLLLRATLPAAFHPDVVPLGGVVSDRIAVLRERGGLFLLPEGADRESVWTTKATLRWDLGSVAGVVGELSYTHDPNRTHFEDDLTGVAQPVFDPPTVVGGSVLLQARF